MSLDSTYLEGLIPSKAFFSKKNKEISA